VNAEDGAARPPVAFRFGSDEAIAAERREGRIRGFYKKD